MNPRACPNRDELSAFVMGTLVEQAAENIARHSANCESCQEQLRVLEAQPHGLIGELRKPRTTPPAQMASLLQRASAIGQRALAADASSPQSAVTAGTGLTLGGANAGAIDVRTLLTSALGPNELGRLGPYRVLKVLGQGGMGVVFQAEDPQLKRPVALKAMLPEVAVKAEARDRFLREARAAAAIEHDHIVTIYQVGEDRGVPYLAMQMLKGMSLEDFLKNTQAAGKTLTLGQILKLGREIARGLAAAHERGLIHRDIKPANIWLDGAALTPVSGMRLRVLAVHNSKVSDLSPIKGMTTLKNVRCESTTVRDLSPLQGLPLDNVQCYGTPITDLTPLRTAPLRYLHCNRELVLRNADWIKNIKTLEKLNGQSPADFWKDMEAKKP